MLLKLEELSFYELICILFPCDIGKRKFVQCPAGTESNFERKWIIFISILAQKLLQLVAKPLSWFGPTLEMVLNLPSANGGFAMLLLNFLRVLDVKRIMFSMSVGNTQWPDNASATFSSFIGHLDKRVELDQSIIPEDLDISWYGIQDVGRIHGGFMKALGLQKNVGWPKEIKQDDAHPPVAYYAIREILRELLKENDQTKFVLTGHSLGGALAILFAAVLACQEETWMLMRLRGIYTFGQPRVGDVKFGEYTTKQLKEHNNIPYFRFVYSNDLVPRLPYDDRTLMFKHFGTCIYYNSLYEGKTVLEEPNKNYFSLSDEISKWANAVWGLIRSVIIGRSKGKEYKEGWFLRAFRMVGLLAPGVSAHGPQDYVNSTRLGSPTWLL